MLTFSSGRARFLFRPSLGFTPLPLRAREIQSGYTKAGFQKAGFHRCVLAFSRVQNTLLPPFARPARLSLLTGLTAKNTRERNSVREWRDPVSAQVLGRMAMKGPRAVQSRLRPRSTQMPPLRPGEFLSTEFSGVKFMKMCAENASRTEGSQPTTSIQTQASTWTASRAQLLMSLSGRQFPALNGQRFLKLRILGRGSFGTVTLVKDVENAHRLYAMKRIKYTRTERSSSVLS